ncbi:hypothetical protein D3C80_1893590 [compost metagenome]
MEAHDFGLAIQASERIFHECIDAHGVDVHLASLAQPGTVLECNCIPDHTHLGLIACQFPGLDEHVV